MTDSRTAHGAGASYLWFRPLASLFFDDARDESGRARDHESRSTPWLGLPRRPSLLNRDIYGRPCGVGRGRGEGVDLGAAVAVGVAVAVAVGVGEGDPQGLTGQLKNSVVAMMVAPSLA